MVIFFFTKVYEFAIVLYDKLHHALSFICTCIYNFFLLFTFNR